MFSQILLNKQNLIDNILYIKSQCGGKICAMVKANAYGHGDREVAKIIDDHIDFFGVSNQEEAFRVKEIARKPIIVFGACEDYYECMKSEIGFALFSLQQAKRVIRIYKSCRIKPLMHLCVNTGMNRYGIRDISECRKIITLLQKHNLRLAGIYTHFSSLTSDENYTKKQKECFEDFRAIIPSEWDTIVHVGGGRSMFDEYSADMHRVGLYMYGYGNQHLKPVMKVKSKVVDVLNVRQGEHVGYLCGFTADKDMTVATIPLGYGDGFPRKMSNKFMVNINGRQVKSVGNICMDSFMVDVSGLKCKVGDDVEVFDDASNVAGLLDTTEYEVLTNMTKFRGDRLVY